MKRFIIPLHAVSHVVNTPIAVALLTLFFYSIFLFLYQQKYSFNPTYFVTAGNYYVNKQEMSDSFVVQRQSQGYDGQFYYRLALDPFSNIQTANGVTLDIPAFRQQRIFYPFLAWVFSLGNFSIVPQILIFINLICITLTGYFGAKISQSNKLPAIFGFTFAFYAGFLFTFSRDLTEILETALLLGGVFGLIHKKMLTGAVCFSLAVLTKESALIVPSGYLIFYFINKIKSVKPMHWVIFTLPYFTFLIFHTWIFIQWHTLSIEKTLFNFDFPFMGIIYFIHNLFIVSSQLFQVYCIELIFLGIFCVILLFIFYKNKKVSPALFIWLLYFIFAIFFSKAIWVEDWAFMRVFSGLIIFGIIYLLELRSKVLYPLTIVNIALWFYLAKNIIDFR